MQIKRTFIIVLLLMAATGVTGQEQSSEKTGADDAQQKDQTESPVTTEIPPEFIPQEKISPDEVISFPADI